MISRVLVNRDSASFFLCDTLEDMCRINAKYGDFAQVNGDVYKYNGGSWTKTGEYLIRETCINCKYLMLDGQCRIGANIMIAHGRCPYKKTYTNVAMSLKEAKPSCRVEYFKDVPFFVCGDCYYSLIMAFYTAWENKIKYIWLHDRFIDGTPDLGDTFEIAGTRWEIKAKEPTDNGIHKRYMLERMEL